MPATPHAKGLVTKFENAARDHAFKGAQRPGDRDAIDDNYELRKRNLLRYISQQEKR